jgi:hypothetical protein
MLCTSQSGGIVPLILNVVNKWSEWQASSSSRSVTGLKSLRWPKNRWLLDSTTDGTLCTRTLCTWTLCTRTLCTTLCTRKTVLLTARTEPNRTEQNRTAVTLSSSPTCSHYRDLVVSTDSQVHYCNWISNMAGDSCSNNSQYCHCC